MATPTQLPAFDRADYSDRPNLPPAPDQCAYCSRGLETEYYRVGGHLACTVCAQRAQSLEPPDSHKAYIRALLFGVGAAIVALIGYTLMSMTGIMIGYVALGVGWLISKAMKAGSRGLGGRRYQITAVLLTYAAISLSFIPLAVKASIQDHRQDSAAASSQASGNAGSQDSADSPKSPTEKPHAKPQGLGGFLAAVLMLLGLGLISPFLAFSYSLGQALFGLLFLYIGMQIAWKMTQKMSVEVDGPFAASKPSSNA